jgi:hypothetical protein
MSEMRWVVGKNSTTQLIEGTVCGDECMSLVLFKSFKPTHAYSIIMRRGTHSMSLSLVFSELIFSLRNHIAFSFLIRYIIIMRKKEIRLSDSEHSRLQNYKTNKYHSTVPFGYVISELLDEAQEE